MSEPGFHAIAAILLAAAMFVAFARDRLAPELISLLTIGAIALLLYFVPLPGQKASEGLALAFSGFGHQALVTICALMVMGRGLVVTGALEPLVAVLDRVWSANRQLGLLTTLLLAMGLSMAVNDTPVLVLLLPVLVQLAARGAMPSSKTLIPVNAAVLIGGMATTIGTSTNLLVVSIAQDLGLPPISVFQFTPLVLVAAVVALPYLWLIMPRLLGDNNQVEEQRSRRFAATLRIGGGSSQIGKTLAEARSGLPTELEINTPDAVQLQHNSRLALRGTYAELEEAARRLGGILAPRWLLERLEAQSQALHNDLVVAEVAVTADSRLVGVSIPSSGIADRYGLAILGVQFAPRSMGVGEPALPAAPPRADAPLGEGDVLLVLGFRESIRELAQAEDLLELEGAHEVPRRSKAALALGIMAGAIALASLGLLPIAIAALGGAILMLATRCVRFDRIGRALSAKVIVLVAASIAIGKLVLASGAADWLGQLLSAGLQFLPPAGVLAAIMLFVTLLTNFASNATAATVGTPIAFSVAARLGLPPEPLVLAVLFGCNLCYATPIAYQTNMLIMAEGGYRFRDYLVTGVPLVLIMTTTLSVLLVLHYGL